MVRVHLRVFVFVVILTIHFDRYTILRKPEVKQPKSPLAITREPEAGSDELICHPILVPVVR